MQVTDGKTFTRGKRPETIPPHIQGPGPRGRVWHFVGVEPYTRKSDGRETTLLRWRAFCSTCGAPFEVLTSNTEHAVSGANTRWKRVNCDEHKPSSNWSEETRARVSAASAAAHKRYAEVWRMARGQVETDEEAHAILEVIL